MDRVLEPEWLDILPRHDARARRSRADLRRVNALMGNARHVARALSGLCRAPTLSIADLGAGDGCFTAALARQWGKRGVHVTLVDRAGTIHPKAAEAFERTQWKTTLASCDVHEFLSRPAPAFDALVANLFLHHFDAASLRRLFELAARRATLFVACEPRRSRFALQASRLLALAGCSEVTRHDAAVSVRAGFRGGELSALWPQQERWQLAERAARPFGHLFVARRHAAL